MRTFFGLLWLIGVSIWAHADDGVPAPASLKTSVKNYSLTTDHIATSGSLSEANLHDLKQHGIRQVIDLRQPNEGTSIEQGWSNAAGVDYVNLPVARGALPDDALVEQLGVLLDQAVDKPTLLHCSSGNRAGIVLAMYFHQRGKTIEQALDIARSTGTRERVIPVLRARLSSKDGG